MKYRIAVLNDFRNCTAFVDCRKYGETFIYGGCLIGPGTKKRQEPKDSITIFLNYQQVGDFKSKTDAMRFLEKLIAETPKEFVREMEELKEYLIRGIGL